LKDIESLKITKGYNNVFATAFFEGYKAELSINEKEKNTFSFKMELTVVGDVFEKIHKITTLNICSQYDKDTRILINHRFNEGVFPINEIPEACICSDFCAFYDIKNTDSAVTITTVLPAKFKSEIAVEKSDFDFRICASTLIPYSYVGNILCQEWIVSLNTSVPDALIKNAERCASSRPFQEPIGWSTWDYYFTSATEDDVKNNIDAILKNDVLSEKVKYIAIDDGWQQREGDWRSGIRYPSGLKNLVDYIKEKGFEAGIWIAPTRLHFLCGTVMRRNEFLVRDEYGDPVMDEDMYVLDPTHPDGEAFLRETFTYLSECGFTFYKLDFISNMITCAERFYDKNAGPFDALYKLIKIVRETVPEGSHIMGCSLPYAMGTDVVDSRRTGWDVHNVWGHIKTCTSKYLPQFAANGRIYRNDLDYLIVRGLDTSADPKTNVINDKAGYNAAHKKDGFVWRQGDDFDYIEAKTWCTIMLMSGSSIFLGDNLTKLNELGSSLITKTISAADFIAAIPVFASEKIPEVWYKPDKNCFYAFNFSENKKSYNISIKTNPGVNNPDIVKPVGIIDDSVNVIRFDREGADTIVFVNFANHPDIVGGNKISADWPGLLRKNVEKILDGTKCIFFNGAQGDVNHVNVQPKDGDLNGMFIDFDDVARGYSHAEYIARVVTGGVLQAYDKVKYVEVESVVSKQKTIQVPSNKPTPEELPEAHRINDLHNSGRDSELPYEGMMLTTIVAEAARMVRLENAPDTFDMILSAVKIGPVAFLGIPGEPFSEIGKQIKDTEGFEMIIPSCNTNGKEGYFPMQDSYDEGGYEARSSNFKAGVGEYIIKESKELIKDLI